MKTGELVVGVVFLASLAILGFFTVLIGDIHLLERPQLTGATFDSVGGLKTGDAVRVAGYQIGRVDSLSLVPLDGKVRVRVMMKLTECPKLWNDYRVVVNSTSAFGRRHIDIYPGRPTAGGPVDPTTELEGSLVGEPMRQLSELIEENRGNVKAATDTLRRIAADLGEGKGTLGRLLVSDKLYEELEKGISAVRVLGEKLGSDKGTLAKLLTDEKLYENLAATATSLRKITKGIEGGQGSLGKLFAEDELYQDAKAALSGVKEFVGTLNESQSKGTLGRLLNDESLYDEAKKALASLSSVAQKIDRGEGTIGKLVNDSTLHDKADKVLTTLEQTVEDARESAPVTTFARVLFSGF